MQALHIIKIGGNVIDNSENLHRFLKDFTALDGFKILVHGGGKVATQISESMGIEAKLVDGRRITDIDTLRVVTMVYGGLINKNVVAQLQRYGNNAIGLTGADGDFIRAKRRPVKTIDYGFAGDLFDGSIDPKNVSKLLDGGFTPVFCALTHDGEGQLLNTNADTIASALAVALSKLYETTLIYCFEKKGVLQDINDEDSLIRDINPERYERLKKEKIIHSGMLPKLNNAFTAISCGVKAVIIGHSDDLGKLKKKEGFGTRLSK
ncbi:MULTISPECIES: acetylglutamate kinase [unclassified Mucilaginibacter]|uniref:acetylglutamate kinase n=1 Tax=unclassified Mucilaginibacter TaxID=2617802 RepID=UPI002AC8B860|nr:MULTISPECIES: acetylglutamate kinase [unclassified Mucilaginibacter]MEB0249157.1 acetylglutamate kinase [Mucilaginibacter sp. 5B2]MEB0260811.1 acetylglutamate kinase [Mucilaginibacter sp. 10I4]MEB0279026.1 acetylglutamate kinase [Mucilaginibacter sp. 10B2]MEB0299955.1 acetylglutamate kinase [Mucilaginibacter sp. 5C4]WPX22204.1 acetylglutamate kinase [Mucilaginibacter sp. 5C4]